MSTTTLTPEQAHDVIEHVRVLLAHERAINSMVPWDKALWTAELVAEYLHVSTRTVERYAAEKDFPAAMRVGSSARWYAAEIVDWVEETRRKTRRNYTTKEKK